MRQNPPALTDRCASCHEAYFFFFKRGNSFHWSFLHYQQVNTSYISVTSASEWKCFHLGSFCLETKLFPMKKKKIINEMTDFHFQTWQKWSAGPAPNQSILGKISLIRLCTTLCGDTVVNNCSGPTSSCQPCRGSADYVALVTGYLAWDLVCIVSVKPDGNEISPL